jgi:hypothetical protein
MIVRLNSTIVDVVNVAVEAAGPTVLIYRIQRAIFPQMNGIAFGTAPIISGSWTVALMLAVGDADVQMVMAVMAKAVDRIIVVAVVLVVMQVDASHLWNNSMKINRIKT